MKKENLNRGSVQSIQLRAGDLVRGESGILWLTFEAEQGDIILRHGDIWKATRRGKVVVQAMTDASLSLGQITGKKLIDLLQPWRVINQRDLLRS
jgi:hypothetical protein